MHHAKEPISMAMNLYIILKLLYEYTINKESFQVLLSTRNIYFIPLINVDGAIENENCYNEKFTLNLCTIRKNRNYDPTIKCENK